MAGRTTAADGSVLGWHERGAGRPLLLLPGLSLGEVCFWPLRLQRDARTVAVDPRGVGASRPARTGGRLLDDAADDVVAVLDAAGLDQVDVAAISWGSAVAQRLLVRHPRRVRRAVLMSCPVGQHPERTAYLEGLVARCDAGDLSGAWADLGPRMVRPRLGVPGEQAWRALGRLVPPLLLRTDATTVAAQVRALLALPDLACEDLRAVRSPVLLVQGAHDRLCPMADTRRLLDLLPDARLHLEPAAGHLAPLRLRRVGQAVRGFLSDQQPAG